MPGDCIVEVDIYAHQLQQAADGSRQAKKLFKDAHPEYRNKTVRHDGHELPNGKTGNPHYQHKNGGKGHVFYDILGTILLSLLESFPVHGGDLGDGTLYSDVDGDGILEYMGIELPEFDANHSEEEEPEKEDEKDEPKKEDENKKDQWLRSTLAVKKLIKRPSIIGLMI